METFLIKAAQLVAALSLLVVLHEFGHYIFARMFGIKVEKFYLFFDPKFALVRWKPKAKPKKLGRENVATWRDTEYGIGWLPLGGYVKIAGMMDESMDKEQLAKPAQPWEFRSKPAWQRLLVMLGGVLFNFILAVIIYAGIAIYWGEKYIPIQSATYGYDYSEPAKEAGFRTGDIPLAADGEPLDAADERWLYRLAEAKTATVLRGNDTVAISLPSNFIARLGKEGLLEIRIPVVAKDVSRGGEAASAGLKAGDRIIAVDTVATPTLTEFTPALRARAGRKTALSVVRSSDTLSLTAVPDEYGKLGFMLTPPSELFNTVRVKYSLLQGIPKGWELGTGTMGTYVSSLKHVFSKEGAQSVGGFGAMGSMFPDRWDWYAFWQITAFFSLALAFMNVLPIPVLDGGHVLFLLYEMVTRRKIPDKVMEILLYCGFVLLIALLLFANGMDLVRAFF